MKCRMTVPELNLFTARLPPGRQEPSIWLGAMGNFLGKRLRSLDLFKESGFHGGKTPWKFLLRATILKQEVLNPR